MRNAASVNTIITKQQPKETHDKDFDTNLDTLLDQLSQTDGKS